MARAKRIHLENTIYYVTLEGPSHENVFRDKSDYIKYLELLSKYKTEYRFKLFSFVLMPNQICLLVEPTEEFPISHIMQKITPTYTKYYNAKHERKGHLFPKRFRSVYVEKTNYLVRVTRFVHSLPERLGLTSKLRDYPYSSLSAFLQETQDFQTFVNLSQEVSEVVNGFIRAEAGNSYEAFMDSQTTEETEFLGKKLSRGVFLGSNEFITEIKKKMTEQTQKEDGIDKAQDGPALEANVPHAITLRSMTVGLSGVLAFTVALSFFAIYLNFRTWKESEALSPSAGIKNESQRVNLIEEPYLKRPNLNGLVMEVELIAVSQDGVKTPIRDRIKFVGKSFESHYFSTQGFHASNYSVSMNDSGVITWETMQKNERGEMVNWHGDWQGNKMEGVLSYQPTGKNSQDFSFSTKMGT